MLTAHPSNPIGSVTGVGHSSTDTAVPACPVGTIRSKCPSARSTWPWVRNDSHTPSYTLYVIGPAESIRQSSR